MGLIACFKFAPRMWFVISVRLGRNRGNLNAKYMSTRMNENNKISAKKRVHHIPNEVTTLILGLVLLFGSSVKN